MRERYQGLSIPALTPSLFSGAGSELDELTREVFARCYPTVLAQRSDYDLNRFVTAAYYYPEIFSRLGPNWRSMTACEIGAGGGIKAMAWAPLFKRYIAVDILDSFSQATNAIMRDVGIGNVETVTANGAQFVHEHLSEIDVLILYAVVEHLTLSEREIVLGAVDAHLAAGGTVVLAECPNRLITVDSHTTQLPFFQSLPDEIAVRYMSRSPLADWLKDKAKFATDPIERLYRLGRGVSYHEFDLFCPNLESSGFDIICDGYDASLLNIEPLQRDEIRLDTTLGHLAPSVPRAFSRYWIEMVARIGTQSTAGRRLRVLAPGGAGAVVPASAHWDFDKIVLRPGEAVEFACEGTEEATLTFDLGASSGAVEVSTDKGIVAEIDVASLKAARPPTWHERAAVKIGLPTGSSQIVVAATGTIGQTAIGPVLA